MARENAMVFDDPQGGGAPGSGTPSFKMGDLLNSVSHREAGGEKDRKKKKRASAVVRVEVRVRPSQS